MTDPLSSSNGPFMDLPTSKMAHSAGKAPGLGLIRATSKVLLLSSGRVIDIARLEPEECERLAIETRAETGVVPYGLWIVLTDKSRDKLAVMTLAMARRILEESINAGEKVED
jgi:hypothetical protein